MYTHYGKKHTEKHGLEMSPMTIRTVNNRGTNYLYKTYSDP